MKPPPFLLAAALLLWGWQTGLLAMALLMAVVLEAARWIEWRLEFDVPDFNRIADLCTVLAAVAMVYCVLTRETGNQVMAFFQSTNFTVRDRALSSVSQTTFIFFQWLPMLLFPAMAALAYSAREQVPLSCFSFFQRRRHAHAGRPQPLTPAFHLGHPYLAAVLFSASLANQRTDWFYFALCAVVAWSLWPLRPRRFSTVIWVGLLILVMKAGYYGHKGLNQLQAEVENKILSWVSNWARRSQERTDAGTAIGRAGRLKLSGKIVMRVAAEGRVPPLLRDSAYTRFDSPRWTNSREAGAPVLAAEDGTAWPLLAKSATNVVDIATFATRGQAVLALPPGTALLHNLLAAEVLTNGHGVVRIAGGPDFLNFRAHYSAGESVQNPPAPDDDRHLWTEGDLHIPFAELEELSRVARDLGLHRLTAREKVRAIEGFFSAHFKYGSFLPSSLEKVPQGMTPLGFFLRKNRVGHCEYFATAAVLLLRRADIPARYVYGWSVQEPERGTGRFIVRERHAHAWCLYWSEEARAWVDLDTTPAEWAETENQNASFLEPLADRWSRAWFAFSHWRWYGGADAWQGYLLVALVSLVALLAWRVIARQRRRRRPEEEATAAEWRHRPGADSEFYRIEARLAELGLGRRPGEALGDWLTRIEPLAQLPVTALRQLLDLHCRLRFDPQGLRQDERAALRAGVGAWLAQAKPA